MLVSEEHVHLLREGADGIVKPFLRDAQGQFVENVDLISVPPDIAGAIATITMQATLTDARLRAWRGFLRFRQELFSPDFR